MKLILAFTLILGSAQTAQLAHAAQASDSDFLNLCKVQLKSPQGQQSCDKLNQLLFASKGDVSQVAPYTPAQVGAPSLPVDGKVTFLAINDPNHASGLAYCYFVFRKWISMAQVSPDVFGSAVSGFAVLNEKLPEYQKWLKQNSEGKTCRTLVESESAVPVTNLEASLKGRTALIALNPYAIIREKGADHDAILKEMQLTTNHERVHAYQVLCPDLEKQSAAKWAALSPKSKVEAQSRYPSYNWADPKIAAREYGAFALERAPEKIQDFTGKCVVK